MVISIIVQLVTSFNLFVLFCCRAGAPSLGPKRALSLHQEWRLHVWSLRQGLHVIARPHNPSLLLPCVSEHHVFTSQHHVFKSQEHVFTSQDHVSGHWYHLLALSTWSHVSVARSRVSVARSRVSVARSRVLSSEHHVHRLGITCIAWTSRVRAPASSAAHDLYAFVAITGRTGPEVVVFIQRFWRLLTIIKLTLLKSSAY